jgi:hypothetical protein
MKRRFALGLVFYLAAAAGAGLQLDIVGGKARVTGQLSSDADPVYLILSAGNGASLSNFGLGDAAPSASVTESQGTAADFRRAGGPIPAGFDGEGWLLASFPNEPYNTGVLLTADVTLTTVQVTRMWEEMLKELCPCVEHGWGIRTWTEVTEITRGAFSLVTYNGINGQWAVADEWSVNNIITSTLTFEDGYCLVCPEPMTLSLLGLGFIMIRRSNRKKQ